MKFDMHCHTKEGSLDGKVGIEEYIRILKEKGYQGMLVSDHNSYNGYRYWRDHIKGKKYTDFVVLKGIEYDTNNAGHFLVILPEGVKPRILEMRGMPGRIADQGRTCLRRNSRTGTSVWREIFKFWKF